MPAVFYILRKYWAHAGPMLGRRQADVGLLTSTDFPGHFGFCRIKIGPKIRKLGPFLCL